MALVKCRECQREVSSEAKACPHCGIADPAPNDSEEAQANTKGLNNDTKAKVTVKSSSIKSSIGKKTINCTSCGKPVVKGSSKCLNCGEFFPGITFLKLAAQLAVVVIILLGFVFIYLALKKENPYSQQDITVCRAYISTAYKRPISIINHRKTDSNGVVYVGYTRDDGTVWESRCRIDRKAGIAVYSTWIKDSKEWGRWRFDEQAMFYRQGEVLTISDPLSGSKNYRISNAHNGQESGKDNSHKLVINGHTVYQMEENSDYSKLIEEFRNSSNDQLYKDVCVKSRLIEVASDRTKLTVEEISNVCKTYIMEIHSLFKEYTDAWLLESLPKNIASMYNNSLIEEGKYLNFNKYDNTFNMLDYMKFFSNDVVRASIYLWQYYDKSMTLEFMTRENSISFCSKLLSRVCNEGEEKAERFGTSFVITSINGKVISYSRETKLDNIQGIEKLNQLLGSKGTMTKSFLDSNLKDFSVQRYNRYYEYKRQGGSFTLLVRNVAAFGDQKDDFSIYPKDDSVRVCDNTIKHQFSSASINSVYSYSEQSKGDVLVKRTFTVKDLNDLLYPRKAFCLIDPDGNVKSINVEVM